MKPLYSLILLFHLSGITYGQPSTDSLLVWLDIERPYDLEEISTVVDSCIATTYDHSAALIDLYEAAAISADATDHIVMAKLSRAQYYDDQRDPERLAAVEDGLAFVDLHKEQLSKRLHAEALIELLLVKAHGLSSNERKDDALVIHHRLRELLDSIGSQLVEIPIDQYHFDNYNRIARLFLFENDEISGRYADSAITKALHSEDPTLIYSAYSLKYYSEYYNGDGAILNTIADSCIKYARLDKGPNRIGEAYMHKCNALVVLGQSTQGIAYCDLAIVEYKKLKDSIVLTNALNNVANVLNDAGESDRALQYFRLALSYTKRDDGEAYYNAMSAVASGLYSVGEYQEAAEYFHRFNTDFYQFYNDKLKNQFADAEAKYQSEIKEAEIERQNLEILGQKSERRVLLFGATSLLILLTALFFGIFQRSKRKRRETQLALDLEQQRAFDLEQLDKVKTDFFNNVSHELRTPLTLVIAPLEDAIGRAQHVHLKQELNLALSNSKRLLHLTNEILDLSKLDGGAVDIVPSRIEVMTFLSRIFHSFDSLAKSQKILLKDNLKIHDEMGVISDASKLETVISNLVANALKYSDGGDTIHLTLNHQALMNEQLEVSIRDEGIGIPLEEQSRIFDRFYQSNYSNHVAGTGIGLALVKELTQVLSGEINVSSKEGGGSTFAITIPIRLSNEPSTLGNVQSEGVDPQIKMVPILIDGQKPSILIVEDDLEMSKYLVSLLEDQYQCDTAFNGTQALDKIRRHHYDLISSDVMMPEMDGFMLREEINKTSLMRSTPYIMLTARMLEEDRITGLQLGVDDYITKPFSSTEFKVRVHNLLKNKLSRSEAEKEDTSDGYEGEFVSNARNVVMSNIDDPSFNVQELADKLNYSRRQLGRLIKKLTGLSPVAFILEIRLQKAYKLIKQQKFSTIKEVRYEVGIESGAYFTTKFKERFGVSPGALV